MSKPVLANAKPPYALGFVMAVQLVCTAFFVGDVVADLRTTGFVENAEGETIYVEMLVSFSLLSALLFELRYLMKLLRRKAHLENSASIANAAIHDVIEAHFEAWQLTPAEQDVANFLVKGLNISEIAEIRGSAEGTVKSHLNAIYRKSGTKGRGELLSLIIDSLMADEDPGQGAIARPAETAKPAEAPPSAHKSAMPAKSA